jgi:phage baseplate assembly protein W
MGILYKGYSTHNYNTLGGTFKVTDVDLVNLDILSHIYTETNERVMMPGFGTSIPNMPFEQLTEDLIEELHDEIDRVIDYDPRVEKIKVVVVPYYDRNLIAATVTLRYIEINVIDDLDFILNLENGN